jgi:transcription-repair coupling factor (superfamily II helicase)
LACTAAHLTRRPGLDLSHLLPVLATVEPLTEVYARLDGGHPVLLGVADAAKPVVAALVWRHARRPALLVVPREVDAELAVEQLQAWTGGHAAHFPSRGQLPYAHDLPDAHTVSQRIAVLSRLARGEPLLVVASAAAVAEHTLAPADLSRGPGRVDAGQRLSLEAFASALVEAGYAMEPLVEAPGQAARRGGLVDAWPVDAIHPYRLEFLGSEVESIRSFDPATQRTVERLEHVTIGPATEWFPERDALVDVAEHLGNARRPEIEEERRALQLGELPAPALYGPLAAHASLLDHIRPDWRLLIDEPPSVAAALHDLDELARERRADLAAKRDLGEAAPFPHVPGPAIESQFEAFHSRADLARWATGHEPGAFRLPFGVADAFAGRLPAAADDARRRGPRGDRTLVVTQQAQRYAEILAEHHIDTRVHLDLPEPPAAGELALVQGALPEGWQVGAPTGVILLQTDRELFGFTKRRRQLRRRESHRSQFLAEVQPGDFVVHADHGIARFGGIVRRPVGDEDRDYLELRYAGDDRLYVPVDQVDRVSRFVGPSDRPPRLTRLGTQEWARARARVREAIAIVAADLVRLYAARQLLEGHAFKPDTEWQRELEDGFPYEETPDQLQALAEVKADMESPRPMDRVICGDVGFGKTEVAIRAAFKAVMDGYQVAVLVPTTVLAQQHEKTFRERLAGFPVTIDVLSRFRSDEEAREVVRNLKSGEIDIVIGTHRLLQSGIEFANLGLVVIDEEQRFGVTHKERLKRMRLEVDVLSLSATPIPRTMHMALSGIRDMSTIDTPPEGRQPVQTFVAEWDDTLVREAILHELERGGQVYVVHNRVHSIDVFADRLRALVPEARMVVGHGQMPESILKRVMERFADGEFDVLVCTTIIESGIDIANVNTLIVDQADRLGLAQLYQLRGRVGRSAHQASAYLLHPRDRVLSEEAQQRLAAIFEASELGAGFQVALRDLEIRGAGNLLGAEQSGHIASVGFDLYTKMLAEAVESMRAAHEGRAPTIAPAGRGPVIDLPASAFIPETYVEEVEARLSLYQRIAALASIEECEALRAETADRLGPIPEPLAQLFALVRLRLAARAAEVASVRLEDDDVVLVAEDRAAFARRRLPDLPRGVRVGQQQVRVSRAALGRDWMRATEALLHLLGGARQLATA